jgi:hypothetical protein
MPGHGRNEDIENLQASVDCTSAHGMSAHRETGPEIRAGQVFAAAYYHLFS